MGLGLRENGLLWFWLFGLGNGVRSILILDYTAYST